MQGATSNPPASLRNLRSSPLSSKPALTPLAPLFQDKLKPFRFPEQHLQYNSPSSPSRLAALLTAHNDGHAQNDGHARNLQGESQQPLISPAVSGQRTPSKLAESPPARGHPPASSSVSSLCNSRPPSRPFSIPAAGRSAQIPAPLPPSGTCLPEQFQGPSAASPSALTCSSATQHALPTEPMSIQDAASLARSAQADALEPDADQSSHMLQSSPVPAPHGIQPLVPSATSAAGELIGLCLSHPGQSVCHENTCKHVPTSATSLELVVATRGSVVLTGTDSVSEKIDDLKKLLRY